jgi:cytochrome c oxidase subunit 2
MTPTLPRPSRPPAAGLFLIAAGLVLNLLISVVMARASHGWLPVPASSAAPYVDGLFALETGIGTFIFLGCLSVIAWTVLFNRAPRYDLVDGDPIEGNTRLEIVWTVLPFVLVMLIAAHTIRVNHTLATLGGKERLAENGDAAALTAKDLAAGATYGPIEVIARQWSWEFVYPNGVRSTELHLPLDRRADLRLTSMDVLHSFYVPAFRLKQDIVPGSVIRYALTPTREGRYRLRDAMFSGGYFATNQTDVVVDGAETFDQWLTGAARLPLVEAPNLAFEMHRKRLADGDHGWATVPPAPPPRVNVTTAVDAPHEA